MVQPTRRALVLAGGGYVASSWEIGLIAGLADAGVDLHTADLLVGTSAGARVALDLASGRPFDAFYQQRVAAVSKLDAQGVPHSDSHAILDWRQIKARVDAARLAGGTSEQILRRYGALAHEVAVGVAADRKTTLAAQLPIREWPGRRLLITAVNTDTGERRAFDRDSGIELLDAVAATTASFGGCPVFFEGQHYIDGGYFSSDNADLAIGYERVLILALRSPPQAMRLVSIEAGVEKLWRSGALVEVIHPDDSTVQAMAATGGQMSPASGGTAAIAGRVQGRKAAEASITAFWQLDPAVSTQGMAQTMRQAT